MIEKTLPFQFIKKSPFYGSYQGMRYRITEMHGKLQVCIFPEPWAFEYTPEEKKVYTTFPFTEEGYNEAILYLNEAFEGRDWSMESGQWQ